MMEFSQKLQELRKQKGLTQEALAQALYVSRTAVSKWESGRGYPNIDSLKAIAKFYEVTVDDLLSGDELLTLAEENTRQTEKNTRNLLYSLFDLSAVFLLFLPFFGQKTDGVIRAVSLLALTEISLYLQIAYYVVVIGMIGWGVLNLVLQNCQNAFWVRHREKFSLAGSAVGVLVFIISSQPYAATFFFLFLIIKALLLMKKQ